MVVKTVPLVYHVPDNTKHQNRQLRITSLFVTASQVDCVRWYREKDMDFQLCCRIIYSILLSYGTEEQKRNQSWIGHFKGHQFSLMLH